MAPKRKANYVSNLYNRQMMVGWWSFLKVLLDCRQCKNIRVSLQHKIYSLNLTCYLLINLFNKTSEFECNVYTSHKFHGNMWTHVLNNVFSLFCWLFNGNLLLTEQHRFRRP
jgi:hypothetical protein